MSTIALSILSLLQYAPQAINEVVAVYNVVKADLSETDQATIDSALASAQSSDALSTSQADIALDSASNA